MRVVLPTLLLLVTLLPASGAQGPPPSEWMLHLYGNDYIPDPMTVPPGATVTIMNFDPEPHTVTAYDRAKFDVTNIQPDPTGQTWRTFTAPAEPGTYPYYCIYHGDTQGNGMAGTLIIDANAQAPTAPSPPATTPTPAGTPPPAASPPAQPTPEAESKDAPFLGLAPLAIAVLASALALRKR